MTVIVDHDQLFQGSGAASMRLDGTQAKLHGLLEELDWLKAHSRKRAEKSLWRTSNIEIGTGKYKNTGVAAKTTNDTGALETLSDVYRGCRSDFDQSEDSLFGDISLG